jgi:sugar-specific transcriptional regulator TrmB
MIPGISLHTPFGGAADGGEMEALIRELVKFQFTTMEASVYLMLVKHHEMNGSQIAKILNVPRTSVYSALDSLYQKGAVHALPGDTKLYMAQNPIKLLKRLKEEYSASADTLIDEISKFDVFHENEEYWNFSGYDNFIRRVKELLMQAKKEIYMNTNCDMEEFRKELIHLGKKGVRIILFTFQQFDTHGLNIEVFYNPKIAARPGVRDKRFKRMMIVADYRHVLIASAKSSGDFIGTFTDNRLLVDIVSEHIHHDIYLLKLEKILGRDFFTEEMKINTLQEKEFSNRVNRTPADGNDELR